MIFFIYIKGMENKSLIQLAKQNDEDAIKELIKENEKMIYGIIKKYRLELGDYQISKEDLYQEGLIAIYQAIKDYEDDHNAKFSTFAHKVISRRIFRFYKKEAQKYNEENYSYSKLESSDHYSDFKTDYVCDNPLEYFDDNYYKEVLDIISMDVDDVDKQIIKLRVEEYTYREIAEKLNISNKLVDYRLRKLKRKFKNEKDKYFS